MRDAPGRGGARRDAAALRQESLDTLALEGRSSHSLKSYGRDLEPLLAALPAVVEQHFGHGDLSELTDPDRITQARALLAELISSITVMPTETKGSYTCTITGDLAGVLRVAGNKREKVSNDGSPGGICTLVPFPRPVRVMRLPGRCYAQGCTADGRSARDS